MLISFVNHFSTVHVPFYVKREGLLFKKYYSIWYSFCQMLKSQGCCLWERWGEGTNIKTKDCLQHKKCLSRRQNTEYFVKCYKIHHLLRYKLYIPLLSTINLSMPRGPNVVRTASAIAWQALILLTICGTPWDVSVPSFRSIMGACC